MCPLLIRALAVALSIGLYLALAILQAGLTPTSPVRRALAFNTAVGVLLALLNIPPLVARMNTPRNAC